MMQPFTRHHGIAAPLQRANIDTDMIIRIERFMLDPRSALGAYAFEMLRRRPDGSEDPDCTLNQPRFAGASILVGGANFGCGSSREAAVWSLAGFGIRSILAPSFGDIFRENCVKNGLLPIVLAADDCADIAGRLTDPAVSPEIEIDLAAGTLTAPGGRVLPFAIGAFEREVLLAGEDEIATTLRRRVEIEAHFARWEAAEPWTCIDLAHSPLIATPPADQGSDHPHDKGIVSQ